MGITELGEDPKTAIGREAKAVVVFYASWCGDCTRSLLYEKMLSAEFEGNARFYRMDAERYERIADKYLVERFPTYVFFKKGKPVQGILAEPRNEEQVRAWILEKIRK
ncbi:MAG: thioredoxin family protein [Candidatus Micrarchaeia archaeon]